MACVGSLRGKPGALKQIVIGQQGILAKQCDYQNTEEQAEQDREDRNHIVLPFLMANGLQDYFM